MLIDKTYYLRLHVIHSKDLPRDEQVSMPEIEKVGRPWVEALTMIPGSCMHGKSLSTANMKLLLLSLANTGIPSLASLQLSHHCSCEFVSHSLHIVAKC